MRWVIFCSISLYLRLKYTDEFQSGRTNDVLISLDAPFHHSLSNYDALRHKLTASCACPIFWDQLEKEGSNTVTLQFNEPVEKKKKKNHRMQV